MRSPIRALCFLAAIACLAAAIFAAPAQAAEPAWAAIAASGPTVLPPVQSEVQKVAIDAEGGSFTLSFEGETTEALAFDVDPFGGVEPFESAQNALEALPSIGPGDVSVSGGPGDKGASQPYSIAFTGALASEDVPQLTADSSGLSGGENHAATVFTSVPGGPGTATIALFAQNVGGVPSSGPMTISFTLPEGVTTTATPGGTEAINDWSCLPEGAGQSSVTCASETPVGPGLVGEAIDTPVIAGPAAAGTKPVQVEVSGGGASGPPATYSMPLTVSSTPAGPGFQSLIAGGYDENGVRDARAGAHPYSASTGILVNTKRGPSGGVVPSGDPKDIFVDLPPGFIGNPVAVPQCPESSSEQCLPKTIVGTVQVSAGGFGQAGTPVPVYNLQAPFGYPAKFKFSAANGILPINVVGGLRSDEDYGLEVGSPNIAQIKTVYGSFFSFWGTPNEHSHDGERCQSIEPPSNCEAASGKPIAFATNATDCAENAISPPLATLNVDTWQFPEEVFSQSIALPPVTECDQLHFESGFTFQPGEAKADSPASFTTNLTVPSEGLTDPSKRTTPEQKTTVVHFPAGVVLNPSAADGLGSCSEAQIGLKNEIDPATGLPVPLAMPNPLRFNKNPNTCPDSSKIGTVEVKTPLLEHTLSGALYLAAQGNANPFGSLFAVYLVIEDPQTGLFIKLPGRTDPDPNTGQITATFDDLPQLPFESLKLSFQGGNRSPFATPTTCGKFTTTTLNTPWSAPESGPPFETEDSFNIDSGPDGSACANTPQQRPFNLGLEAGSADTNAGAFTPFSIRLTRPDGAQELSSLEITTPPGFTASLKGIPDCTEAEIAAAEHSSGKAEQANPACPAASQVGTTEVGAGSGPNPFYAPGNVYLSGPYKGAPLSVVAITPAVAGPFDLGTVVVRSALHVDPTNAQITAVTDPLPEFLKGAGLRIRDIRINLDRHDWALNPTSCNPSAVDVVAHGSSGAVANLSNRFQVGNCAALGFRPKLTAKLKGGTKRGDHPAFSSTLTYPQGGGYANVASASVTLPHSEFLDQAHIRTVCTRVQFAAKECPAGSIYGQAEATTPLLDSPLSGNVYLRSSANKLPDLVAVLKGPASMPIEIDLDGRVDSVKGGIRTTFESVPDAPVSKFTISLAGGKRGLLINSRDLCAGKPARMTVRLIAQNGKRADQFPLLANGCGRQAKQKHRAKHHKRSSRRRLTPAELMKAGW